MPQTPKINNGFGELLPIDVCDFGFKCDEPVSVIVASGTFEYTNDRRPMCARHAPAFAADLKEFGVQRIRFRLKD